MIRNRLFNKQTFIIILTIELVSTVIYFAPKHTQPLHASTNDWIQLAGDARSEYDTTGTGTNKDMVFTLPAGTTFNISANALTSLFAPSPGPKYPNSSPATIGSPPPGMSLTNYPHTNLLSNISYTTLESRETGVTNTTWDGSTVLQCPSNADQVYDIKAAVTISIAQSINGLSATPCHIIVFINSDLNIQKNIVVNPGGFLAFIVKGNINIDKAVTNVDGIYYADGKICTQCNSSGIEP